MSSNIRIEKTCLFCSEIFITKTTVTKYCSDNCAKRAYKKRKRQEKLQVVDAGPQPIPKEHNPLQDKEFPNIQESCQLLGMSRWTLYRMIKTNQLKAAKFGRRTIIMKSDINKLFHS
ncbi:DNA-binding protein [Cytophagales bacterium RKSG123]|nr:DNA-binding protein [Xanthovirga aplysinae]